MEYLFRKMFLQGALVAENIRQGKPFSSRWVQTLMVEDWFSILNMFIRAAKYLNYQVVHSLNSQ
jgi:hypothetical protein